MPLYKKTCKNCSILFKTQDVRQIYCSGACKSQAHRFNKSCYWCGIVMRTVNDIIEGEVTTCGECNTLYKELPDGAYVNKVLAFYHHFVFNNHLLEPWHGLLHYEDGDTPLTSMNRASEARNSLEKRAAHIYFRSLEHEAAHAEEE